MTNSLRNVFLQPTDKGSRFHWNVRNCVPRNYRAPYPGRVPEVMSQASQW